MKLDLSNPIFNDDAKAREYFETIRWPNGPYCPHCGNADPETITKLASAKQRPGLYQCRACREQFSVTVGSVMESSHVPLHKWALGFFLMASSKKGVSALQLQRMLGLGSYRTAWFMCHRIREAMKPGKVGPIGGEGKVVESDETVIGGKAKNRAFKPEPKKQTVLSLLERDGMSYSFHVANVKASTLRETIVRMASRKSTLMTDESTSYISLGAEFANHLTVNHSADEYARLGGFVHVNTMECRFSLMKRAVFGAHHSVSEAHLVVSPVVV